MACKIDIKQTLENQINDRVKSEGIEGAQLKIAQEKATKINSSYEAIVVKVVEGPNDYTNKVVVNIPSELIDKYHIYFTNIETEEARAIQKDDADRSGEEYDDDYLFQLEEQPISKASPEILSKVKEAAKKMGISIQSLSDYLKGNPNVNAKGINALADAMHKVIAVAEGKEDVALTEELVHIATAMLEMSDPKMVTEMISKIGNFKIYQQTFDAYKSNPAYQLPNGKPNIRKIKKEAIDKLIAEIIVGGYEGTSESSESLEEVTKSWIRNLWNTILDKIRGLYKKSNIDIFQQVASKVIEGEITGEVTDQSLYYQLSKSQEEFQQKLINTRNNIQKVESKDPVDPMFMDTEEANNWYEIRNAAGQWERIKKRVTDRVKAWYRQKFPNKNFTPEEKAFNELKRTTGVKGHSFIEEIHKRWFNSDGTRKTVIDPRPVLDVDDQDVYIKLEKYYSKLIDSFSKDGKQPLVFSEAIIYDPTEKEAGTLDLIIVEEDGTVNIFDWKFMSPKQGEKDVAWFKQGAYNIQLGRYKEILMKRYGVNKIGMNRAIPILMDFQPENSKVKNSKLVLKGIVVGSVNTALIEDLRLVPVSEETETTGQEPLDELIRQLNTVYRQISKKTSTSDEEREFKSTRLNIIKEAIRLVQGTGNIKPLVEVIKQMRVEGQMITDDYNTIYKSKASGDDSFTNKQLSDFAEEMREYIAVAKVFGDVADQIGDLIYTPEMSKDAKTEAQKEELESRKQILESIEREAKLIRASRKQIRKISGEFADRFIGERNLVTGLLKPEAIIKGLASTFRGISELPSASLQVLFKLIENAKSRASKNALEEVNELLEIRKKLAERGGNLRQLVKAIYQKDDDNKIVNKLIYKYDKSFFTTIDDNAKQEKPSKAVIKDAIDVEAYTKEATAHRDEVIAYIKRKHEGDEETINRLVAEEHQKWDIDNKYFHGWNNYIIKRHPKEKWQSTEYKELSKDPDLLALYNFISKINKKATSAGYLQNQGAATFLPFVRKSFAESLAWDFSLSAISNWGQALQARADDVGYGSVNELTGELENSIPKYYTYDFTKGEDGKNDYTDVSEDLFKNIILYINHMEKYTQLSEIEGQLQLVKTIETFKNHLNTTQTGDVVREGGKPKEFRGNEENAKLFDDFFRALLYEQKYPLSNSDIPLGIGKVMNFIKESVNTVVGREVWKVDDAPSAISLMKTLDAANRYFQIKTLGFEFISGAVNIFGGNIQVATQAGNYFKTREFVANEMKLIGNSFSNTEEREMFIQLVDTFMPLKDDPTYDKLKEAGMSVLTQHNFSDLLMVFMRNPEQHLEKSIFLTLLDNMMVENGKIVSIREFVKSKYPNRTNSSIAYKETSIKIDEEIAELQKTRSISVIKKLENGKLVIPGLDLSNQKEIQRLTNLTRRISRNATGALSNSDLNRMGMSIWTKSMMVFKNWIPKLVDTRFSEFRRVSDDFSVIIDENGLTTGEKYDIGRIRLWGYVLGTSIRDKTSNLYNIIAMNDQGIAALDKMYDDFAEKYRLSTGQEMNMSKEDFVDMIRTNLQNQVKELATLLSLFGSVLALGFMVPDEEDDRASKNFYRWSQKVVDKFITELSFFYNPMEFQRMLSGSAFPAMGIFIDIEKFISHFFMETTGMDLSNSDLTREEVLKKAQPIKYASKMFPVTKSVITYISLFNDDFAREFDITIQKQSNR